MRLVAALVCATVLAVAGIWAWVCLEETKIEETSRLQGTMLECQTRWNMFLIENNLERKRS